MTRATTDESVFDTAGYLLAEGFWPIVLHAVGERLGDCRIANGKEPVGKAWGLARPTISLLRDRIYEAPGRGIGLRLGPEAGIIDIEVDGVVGETSFRRLFGDDEIPETMSWTSARGVHRIFRWSETLAGLKAVVKLREYPDLEFRLGQHGSQTQSACPPTLASDGTPRQWGPCRAVAELPGWILREIVLLAAMQGPAMAADVAPPPLRDAESHGRRKYGLTALGSQGDAVANATKGARNATLNTAAFKLGRLIQPGILDRKEVEVTLRCAAGTAGLSSSEIEATLRSGIEAGMKNPAVLVPLTQASRANGRKRDAIPTLAGGDEVIEYGEELGVWASSVPPEAVLWLWPGYIPKETITTFAGAGGVGKTFTLCDLTARVSAGLEWPSPGGECAEVGNVLYISGEDIPAKTLVPRLMAQGANLDRVRFLRVETLDEFMLGDIGIIRRAVAEMGSVSLIVIDPPSCFLGDVGGHRIDGHSDSDLRRLLSPLSRLAAELGTALVFNSHINKANGKAIDAAMRVIGSVAWVNAARAAFMFAKDVENPENRVFASLKSNLGPEPPSLGFTITSTADGTVLHWTGVVQITADEALNGRDEEKTSLLMAEQWLVERFREKPTWSSKELLDHAEQDFGSEMMSAIKKARLRVGIKARQVGRMWESYVTSDWPFALAEAAHKNKVEDEDEYEEFVI